MDRYGMFPSRHRTRVSKTKIREKPGMVVSVVKLVLICQDASMVTCSVTVLNISGELVLLSPVTIHLLNRKEYCR